MCMTRSFAYCLLEAHIEHGNNHDAVHDLAYSLIHEPQVAARVAFLLAQNEKKVRPLIDTVLASDELPGEARMMLTEYILA